MSLKFFSAFAYSHGSDGGDVVAKVGQVFRQIDVALWMNGREHGRFLVRLDHHDLQVHRGRFGGYALVGGRGPHLELVAGLSLRNRKQTITI